MGIVPHHRPLLATMSTFTTASFLLSDPLAGTATSTIAATSLSKPMASSPRMLLRVSKGGIVALGKFDALHIGHRELAIQASKAGSPFLLSFVGMADVLGWEPWAPIAARCDRKRVLSSWASHCGNVAPQEFQMEFSSVRSLIPREFVENLVKEIGISMAVTIDSGKNTLGVRF